MNKPAGKKHSQVENKEHYVMHMLSKLILVTYFSVVLLMKKFNHGFIIFKTEYTE